jgi:hypothetical protein
MRASGYALDTTWRTLLKDLGVAPADVLRRVGLADDLLQQPTVRLAAEDYYRLWRSIETEMDGAVLAVELCRRYAASPSHRCCSRPSAARTSWWRRGASPPTRPSWRRSGST